MVTWREFAAQTPELAAVGRELLLIDTPEMPGAGLGYLATVKRDGSPRVHPISPAIHDDHLYAFILRSSPKLGDLQGDPRFALHAWPRPFGETWNDEEWYAEGRASPVVDRATHEEVARIVGDDPSSGKVFELRLAFVLRKHRSAGRVIYDRWRGLPVRGSPMRDRR
jgi:hypothetical protein